MLPASDVRSPTFCTLCLPKRIPIPTTATSGNRSLPFLLGGPVSKASPQPTSPVLLSAPDQLRTHFAAKRLPSGFQIDGAIESPQ
jgi:hypothetical protein